MKPCFVLLEMLVKRTLELWTIKAFSVLRLESDYGNIYKYADSNVDPGVLAP